VSDSSRTGPDVVRRWAVGHGGARGAGAWQLAESGAPLKALADACCGAPGHGRGRRRAPCFHVARFGRHGRLGDLTGQRCPRTLAGGAQLCEATLWRLGSAPAQVGLVEHPRPAERELRQPELRKMKVDRRPRPVEDDRGRPRNRAMALDEWRRVLVAFSTTDVRALGRDGTWIQLLGGPRRLEEVRPDGQPGRGLEQRAIEVGRRQAEMPLLVDRQATDGIRRPATMVASRHGRAPRAIRCDEEWTDRGDDVWNGAVGVVLEASRGP
jgi:hypothetical protein